MTKYIVAWQQRHGTAGGSWVPMGWERARATLADTLRRNLSLWSDAETANDYATVLTELDNASEPPSRGLTYTLRFHVLTITREG